MNFNQDLEEKVTEINQIIEKQLPRETGLQKLVIEAMNYSVKAGGKRIRPMIMMETYLLCGGTRKELVYPFMATLECIHTYSLVHDDLPAMDNDEYRRGKLTTHKKYGEDFGVLAGDGLLNYAYELMLQAMTKTEDASELQNSVKAAQVIAKKAGIYGMVGGQSLDVFLTDKPMNPEQLDFIFHLKTGALIEAAFMAGAILAGANEDVIHNMEQVGSKVGYAFQIKDDILDVESTQEVLGKPVLSDEKNNKTTYVTIFGTNKAQSDVERLSEDAIRLLKQSGSNEFLIELIFKLINREK